MSVSRRQFIASSATAAATVGLMGMSRALAADIADIRVATIGVNGRGQSHLEGFAKSIVAICDVDEKVLHQRADKFAEKNGRKPELFTDYRKVLEREDINAVSIATPDHTHALIAVAAAQAGKDVYLEKPIAQTIWESRQVVNAAHKYNRVMQCGTQARSCGSIKAAVEFVRSGELGTIRYAVGTCYKPRPSIGKLNKPLAIPNSIDYDLWCGPAAKMDLYRPNLHYDWHWDFNTGNGDLANQGIHQLDVARWFLGEDKLAPRVVSIGGRFGYEDAGDTPNTHVVYFDYPNAPLLFEVRGLPRSRDGQRNWAGSMEHYRGIDIGTLVQCEQGYVTTDASYSSAHAFDNRGQHIKSWREPNESHFDNWLQAVASRNSASLNAEIHKGHISSSLCFTGCISHRLGERKPTAEIAEQVAGSDLLANFFDRQVGHLRANGIDIDSQATITLGPWLDVDSEKELFVGNDAANQLRTREQRAPFTVPDLEQPAMGMG